MTDVAEQAPEQTTEAKPAKVKPEPHPCICPTFEVGEEWEENGQPMRGDDTTGCTQTTYSTFAQGHDARLVSFLVTAQADGMTIWQQTGGVLRTFDSAESACASISEALGLKAQAATEKKLAERQAKADREAAKTKAREDKAAAKAQAKADREAAQAKAKADKEAAKTKDKPQAEVVAGSHEGDRPEPAEGLSRIKIGRWEYDAVIDEEGNASYRDGKGEEQVAERDQYRLLDA